jgi:cobalt-precorrin-7 (C5)-methyltransferase
MLILAQVWLPSELQSFSNGQQIVDVVGTSVRQIVNNLDLIFPGIRQELYDEELDQIVGSIAVIVDGETSQLGFLEKVNENSEIHFLPAIGGGIHISLNQILRRNDVVKSTNSMVTVMGIGPGDPEFITVKAKNILADADVVAGFTTVMSVVSQYVVKGNILNLTYRNQEELLTELSQYAEEGKKCVLCAWGDINFSASELIDRIRNKVSELQLIPCVSSVQIAATRSRLRMEESIFITMHKRLEEGEDLDELKHYLKEGKRNLIIIPRPFDLMPQAIAQGLIHTDNLAQKMTTVYQKLSLPDEMKWEGTLKELSEHETEFSDLSIIVIGK